MILLSPSKGQDFSPVSPGIPASEPEFAGASQQLIQALHVYDIPGLQGLMHLSPALAERTQAAIQALATSSASVLPERRP